MDGFEMESDINKWVLLWILLWDVNVMFVYNEVLLNLSIDCERLERKICFYFWF